MWQREHADERDGNARVEWAMPSAFWENTDEVDWVRR
jgi:hypothetical protein